MGDDTNPDIGMAVYAEDGTKLGHVRGFDRKGFYVTAGDDYESLSVEHERAGHDFGEAELLWRCSDCGEVGHLDDMPDQCPNCGAAREYLYYWTED